MAFVNKMDRSGADYFNVIADMQAKAWSKCSPFQVPIGDEETFKGVVDLVTNKAMIWNEEDFGSRPVFIEIPEDLKELVHEKRAELVEASCRI